MKSVGDAAMERTLLAADMAAGRRSEPTSASRRRLLAACAATAWPQAAVARQSPDWIRPFAGGHLHRYAAFPSRAIGSRAVSIWTPRDYPVPGLRYATIYLADGQNMFLPQEAYLGRTWGVAEHLQALIDPGRVRPAILVGVANALARRGQEYAPAAGQSPEGRAQLAADWGGPSTAERYVAFLTDELKPSVDRHFATDPRPAATFLMGSSLGAIISLYAFASRPDIFGGVAALSPHWPLRSPQALEAGGDATGEGDGFLAWLAAHLPPSAGRRVYLDRGTATLDARYGQWDARVDAAMARRGYTPGPSFEHLVFPGAAHDEDAWRARLDAPLRFLLGLQHVARSRGQRRV